MGMNSPAGSSNKAMTPPADVSAGKGPATIAAIVLDTATSKVSVLIGNKRGRVKAREGHMGDAAVRLQKEQRSAVNREVVLSPGCLEDTQMELSSRGEL